MARKTNGKFVYPTEEELREFDQEFIADTFKPLSKANRLRWERMQRAGTEQVPIDARLLKKVDALAKKKRMSRERLIERGLEALLTSARNEQRLVGDDGRRPRKRVLAK